MRKPTFWFTTWSDTNRAAQPQKMARDMIFRKKRDCTIRVAKTKALISFAVTAKLICVFVFAYAKRFSHDAAHIDNPDRQEGEEWENRIKLHVYIYLLALNMVFQRCILQQLTKWLVCQTPPLDFPGENITVTSPKEVQYGFHLDGVMTYLNISKDFGPMEYFPDPEIEELPPKGDNAKKYADGEVLVIKVCSIFIVNQNGVESGLSHPFSCLPQSHVYYAPNFEKVDGAYCFWSVR